MRSNAAFVARLHNLRVQLQRQRKLLAREFRLLVREVRHAEIGMDHR